jgi:hypothetical protein
MWVMAEELVEGSEGRCEERDETEGDREASGPDEASPAETE